MLEAEGLFFLVDLPLELPVNGSGLSFLLIVKLILNHSAQMMQESNRSKHRRPIAVGLNAVQELLGILIAMLRCGGQISDGFFIIPFDLFSVEINLSELVFCIVVSVLRGNFEVTDCPKDIFDISIRQPNLSGKIGGIGILLYGGSFQVLYCTRDILRYQLAVIEELSHLILCGVKSFFSRVGKKSDCLGDIL